MNSWAAFSVFLLMPFNTWGWKMRTVETKEFRAGLYNNGSLYTSEKYLNCGTERLVYLVASSYHQVQCSFVDGCVSTHEEPLLPAEEFHLHQLCSMQRRCSNLTFPLRSEAQKHRTNAVFIEYQCIGGNNMIRLCGQEEINFFDTIYLSSVDIIGSFTNCECFISNGQVLVALSDIRLTTKSGNYCSPSQLQVNTQQYHCDNSKQQYGSVLNGQVNGPFTDIYITLMQNSKTILPEMILITLIPDSHARIKCRGKQDVLSLVKNSTSVQRTPHILLQQMSTSDDNYEKGIMLLVNNSKALMLRSEVNIALAAIIAAIAVFLTIIILFKQRNVPCKCPHTRQKFMMSIFNLLYMAKKRQKQDETPWDAQMTETPPDKEETENNTGDELYTSASIVKTEPPTTSAHIHIMGIVKMESAIPQNCDSERYDAEDEDNCGQKDSLVPENECEKQDENTKLDCDGRNHDSKQFQKELCTKKTPKRWQFWTWTNISK